MKILWVKAGGLVPLDTGGKIRSYNLIRELARNHHVTLLTYYSPHDNDAHGTLEQIVSRVVCLPIRLPSRRSLAGCASYVRNLFSPLPYSMARYRDSEVARKLLHLLQTEAYDVIICDFLVAACVISWDFPCPKILFTHNVESMICQRHFLIARNPFWKFVWWREYRAMARVERFYIQKADHVLAVSDTDRDYFSQLVDAAKITVVPTGVDMDYFKPLLGHEQPNTLVFTGSMDWMPNEDGVLYFTREILPHIRRRVPDVTFWVVGRKPTPQLKSIPGQHHDVYVTGTVDDIRPYLGKASVYVVPLRIGGGTRLKIFEAMAMGKAIVATSIAAEGLPVNQGKNIILADEPQEFAQRVVNLLKNSHLRAGLGQAALKAVEQKHSWASVAAHLEAALASVTGNTH